VPGALRLGYFQAVIGSREVNFDFNPDWIGRGRELRAYVIDAEKAEALLGALSR
jgi:hypothetical protein